MIPLTDIDLALATREATTFLRRLIQFDTTNPPGNEMACARWIADVFEREGLPSTILEPAPGRGSIVAHLPADVSSGPGGHGARGPLLLLSHLDVVPAVAADWEHDPFGGELVAGDVWGRGALDTKNLTALWMEVLLLAKRRGVRLERDIVFAATADEEAGGTWGVEWITDHRPELLDSEFCLNEGGGDAVTLGGRTIYVCQTAEKGVCWTRVTAHGTAGHASMPHWDNPVVHLAGALHKLGTTRLPMHVTDTLRLFAGGLAATLPPDLSQAARSLLEEDAAEAALGQVSDEYLADTVRAMSRNTACPTVLKASDKVNVIPQTATAEVDCRILPGQTPEDLLGELRAVLGLKGEAGEKIELSLDRTSLASESPPDTPLTRALERAVARHDPQARVVPHMSPGATDSRHLRPRGTICYGFCPTLPNEDLRTIHGKNERISVKSLEFGLAVLWDAVAALVGPDGAEV